MKRAHTNSFQKKILFKKKQDETKRNDTQCKNLTRISGGP